MRLKKFLVVLVAFVLLVGMTPISVLATDDTTESRGFSDMPTNWSTEALQHAVDNELLIGSDGKLNPKGNLTRAEMATIIARAFNAYVEADISAFSDVGASQWYTEYIAKAYQMKIMKGSNGLMKPQEQITRQEAFVMIARALKLAPAYNFDKNFSDANQIANWAQVEVAALVNAGYIQGADGKLNPTGKITRAEFAQLMKNVIEHYIIEAGVVTADFTGNVMVNVADVTLKDSTINGDLIIGEGVGEGDVTLDNVTVTDRLIVRGGGIDSIHIIGGSNIKSLIITRVDGKVRVVTEDGSEVEVVIIEDGSDDVVLEGNFGKVTVLGDDIKVDATNATITDSDVSGSNSEIVTEPEGGGTPPPVVVPVTIVEIAGDPVVGATLTAEVNSNATGTITYQWQTYTDEAAEYEDISGATSATFAVTEAYIGYSFKVVAKGANNSTKTSEATTEVAKVLNQSNNSGYEAIQAAINAATDGNTILVGAGTYNEAVEINKPNLTLKAIGDAIIDKPVSTTDHEKPGIAILANMGEVTVEGFKVKGFRNGINQGMSQSEGTKAHVLNNEVWPETSPNNGYMRNGIQVTGNGSTVKGNTLHGAPLTADWASTAIHVVNANDVLVENNTVTGPADIGIGVLNYASSTNVSGIVIKNNDINGSINGIRVNGKAQADVVENITVQGNTLEAGEVGTYGVNIQKVTFKNSEFTGNDFTNFGYDIRISSTSATVENVKDNADLIVLPTGVTIEWDTGGDNPKIGDTLTAKLQPEGAKGTDYTWRYHTGSWVTAQAGPSSTFVAEVANKYYYVVAYDKYGHYVSSYDTEGYTEVVELEPAVVPTTGVLPPDGTSVSGVQAFTFGFRSVTGELVELEMDIYIGDEDNTGENRNYHDDHLGINLPAGSGAVETWVDVVVDGYDSLDAKYHDILAAAGYSESADAVANKAALKSSIFYTDEGSGAGTWTFTLNTDILEASVIEFLVAVTDDKETKWGNNDYSTYPEDVKAYLYTITQTVITVSSLDQSYYATDDTLTFTINGLRPSETVIVCMPIFTGDTNGSPWASDEEVITGMTLDVYRYYQGTSNASGELTVSETVQPNLPAGELHVTLPEYGYTIDNTIELKDGDNANVRVGPITGGDVGITNGSAVFTYTFEHGSLQVDYALATSTYGLDVNASTVTLEQVDNGTPALSTEAISFADLDIGGAGTVTYANLAEVSAAFEEDFLAWGGPPTHVVLHLTNTDGSWTEDFVVELTPASIEAFREVAIVAKVKKELEDAEADGYYWATPANAYDENSARITAQTHVTALVLQMGEEVTGTIALVETDVFEAADTQNSTDGYLDFTVKISRGTVEDETLEIEMTIYATGGP